MNISGAVPTSQVQTGDGVSILMLRKALDQQQQAALQLLQALPPVQAMPQATPDPGAMVGGTINTYA
ncbi:putative motility protein [Zoogloea sp.]|uniref:putative motility protein n=1 Tax=Zoogloea sp. TaxID=49181 RepID=UPI0026176657|nr:putative motility protein [Zoogloea sp.]MDD3352562.1 putative motility protein [Zoogloea sp.]